MLKALSKVGLLVMIAAIVGLYKVDALFSPAPVVIGVQVAAVALMIWARLTFGLRSFHAFANPTAGGLVTNGPYRFIRHPIYTAACVVGWAGMVTNLTLASAAFGLMLLVGAFIRMYCEEQLVVETYPEYREYAARTKRMIPGVF